MRQTRIYYTKLTSPVSFDGFVATRPRTGVHDSKSECFRHTAVHLDVAAGTVRCQVLTVAEAVQN